MTAEFKGRNLLQEDVQICSRCIYDSSIRGITFNKKGECNYCEQIDLLSAEYGTGTEKGIKTFELIVEQIKKSGKGKRYDIAIGVSGGTDSSYMLVLARKYGLRPLAVHYNNTWNTSTAVKNIYKVTRALDIDLYTYVVNNKESEDILRSFIKASVPEVDGPTDLAMTEVMYRGSSKYGIKYIFEGHSFLEEGIAPLNYSYFDGKYISSIHKLYGNLKMKTFPNLTFTRFLYWTLINKIKRIRPFWYIPYAKKDAKVYLKNNFGWEDYGGHHLENRLSSFHHSFYNPIKFGMDQRNNLLSALTRTGKITRDEAITLYAQSPNYHHEDLNYIIKRLDLTQNEFWQLIKNPNKLYTDYKSYKKRFEFLRPLFYILAKSDIVPMSFYLKYCIPQKFN